MGSSRTEDANAQPTRTKLDDTGARKRRRLSPAGDVEVSDDNTSASISDSDHESESEAEQKKNQDAPPARPNPTPTISRIKTRRADLSVDPPASIRVAIKEKSDFAALDVDNWLVASLSNMAIKHPTGIQQSCIPEILKGRDCIGGSRTGSGKTVAFTVPILQQWARDPSGIFAVVLTPTR